MPKRKFSTNAKKPRANTIRDRRLTIDNCISRHKSCLSCGSSTLRANGTFSNGNKVWTYCTQCKLNENGGVNHTHTHLTGWEDVYSTLVDAYHDEYSQ